MWREDELEALLTLHTTGLVGSVLLRRLLDRFGSVTEAVRAPRAALEQVAGIGPITSEAIVRAAREGAGARMRERAAKAGIRILTPQDEEYPFNLKAASDHPIVLTVRGHIRPEDRLAIGIVGSRRCSDYGRRQAMRLATALARLGICVVSGLARGVDTAAHEGALRPKDGRTIAVLGSGLLRLYPPENKELYRRIADRGAVVSEFPLDMDPKPQNFPRRNRIISGLSLGVVVVEATLKSGAMITADFAAEQNRELFAVPGNLENPLARGPHLLIQQGGKLVQDVEDILSELPAFRALAEKIPREPALSPAERLVRDALGTEPRTVEDLAVQTNLPAGIVQSALTALVEKSLARPEADAYVRTEPRTDV